MKLRDYKPSKGIKSFTSLRESYSMRTRIKTKDNRSIEFEGTMSNMKAKRICEGHFGRGTFLRKEEDLVSD